MIYILMAILALINFAQFVHFRKQVKKIEQDIIEIQKKKPIVVDAAGNRSIFSIMYGNP